MSEMIELCCGAVDRWILVPVPIIGSTEKLSATNSRQQLPFYELPHGRQTLPKIPEQVPPQNVPKRFLPIRLGSSAVTLFSFERHPGETSFLVSGRETSFLAYR